MATEEYAQALENLEQSKISLKYANETKKAKRKAMDNEVKKTRSSLGEIVGKATRAPVFGIAKLASKEFDSKKTTKFERGIASIAGAALIYATTITGVGLYQDINAKIETGSFDNKTKTYWQATGNFLSDIASGAAYLAGATMDKLGLEMPAMPSKELNVIENPTINIVDTYTAGEGAGFYTVAKNLGISPTIENVNSIKKSYMDQIGDHILNEGDVAKLDSNGQIHWNN